MYPRWSARLHILAVAPHRVHFAKLSRDREHMRRIADARAGIAQNPIARIAVGAEAENGAPSAEILVELPRHHARTRASTQAMHGQKQNIGTAYESRTFIVREIANLAHGIGASAFRNDLVGLRFSRSGNLEHEVVGGWTKVFIAHPLECAEEVERRPPAFVDRFAASSKKRAHLPQKRTVIHKSTDEGSSKADPQFVGNGNIGGLREVRLFPSVGDDSVRKLSMTRRDGLGGGARAGNIHHHAIGRLQRVAHCCQGGAPLEVMAVGVPTVERPRIAQIEHDGNAEPRQFKLMGNRVAAIGPNLRMEAPFA